MGVVKTAAEAGLFAFFQKRMDISGRDLRHKELYGVRSDIDYGLPDNHGHSREFRRFVQSTQWQTCVGF